VTLTAPLAARRPTRYSGRAFGLDLRSDFDVPEVADGRSTGAGRPTSLRRLDADEAQARWQPERPVVVVRQLRPAMTLVCDAACGYRLDTERFGSFLFGHDAATVWCGGPDPAAPAAVRFLTGQVLPLAAVLRGLEVFHASAVEVGGRTVALVGDSGAGKSSLAIALMLAGGRLVTDDVLAVEADPHGRGVLAHPGAGVMNVRHAEAQRLGLGTLAVLGPVLSEDRKGVRLRVRRAAKAVPVTHLFFLNRGAPVAGTTFEPMDDPRRLLAGTFNFAIRTPERMARQLDVCARLGDGATVERVAVSLDVGPDELAAELLRRLRPDARPPA
jgi:hypothetical protein